MAYDKLFPGQKDSEKVFLLIRKHWFTYGIFWLVVFLMLIPAVFVGIYVFNNSQDMSLLAGNLIILAGSIYFLFILAILLYGFVDYYLDVYIVTDRRIVDIKQNGFFKREISELHLHQVQDVNAKVNGFFATLFHYGEVYIQTAGEHENFIFESVPHPYRISKTIIDLHEASLENGENGNHKNHNSGLEYECEDINSDDLSGPKITSDCLEKTKEYMKSTGLRETRSSDEKESVLQKSEQENIIKQLDRDEASNRRDVKVKKIASEEIPEKEDNLLEEGREANIN